MLGEPFPSPTLYTTNLLIASTLLTLNGSADETLLWHMIHILIETYRVLSIIISQRLHASTADAGSLCAMICLGQGARSCKRRHCQYRPATSQSC